MSRRTLPSRSTRGQRQTQSVEQQGEDDKIYAQMFGGNLDDDEDYNLSISAFIQKEKNRRIEKEKLKLRGNSELWQIYANFHMPEVTTTVSTSNNFNVCKVILRMFLMLKMSLTPPTHSSKKCLKDLN